MINHHAVDQPAVELVSGSCPEMYEGRLRSGRPFYFRYRHGVATLKVEADDILGEASIEVGEDGGIFEGYEQRDEVFARLYRQLVVLNWPGRLEPSCLCPDAVGSTYVPSLPYCPRCEYGSGFDGLCPDRCRCCVLVLDNAEAILAGKAWIV